MPSYFTSNLNRSSSTSEGEKDEGNEWQTTFSVPVGHSRQTVMLLLYLLFLQAISQFSSAKHKLMTMRASRVLFKGKARSR